MRRTMLAALAALLLITGALVTGCGDDDNDETASTTGSQTEATAAGTDSGAAELRAGLTALLQEHVYLAGTAVAQGVGNGLDSKEFEASAATLDANSVGLSEAIGSVYGDEAGEQFLALWRDHISFFVDYTKARAGKDDAAADKARADLDGYRAEFGAFIASANPNLTKEAVAEELVPHVDSVFDTIDAVVAGDPETFDLLRAAAGHMPATANVLAGAIVEQMPDKFGSQ
ncbi:MAG TPA: hypothetical protein VNT32_14800 [Thermoleophilaceae bacterium]|nr:hypothetical protein [Thermoleophilaceae bacterium]